MGNKATASKQKHIMRFSIPVDADVTHDFPANAELVPVGGDEDEIRFKPVANLTADELARISRYHARRAEYHQALADAADRLSKAR